MFNVEEHSEAVIKIIIKRSKSHTEACFANPRSCFGWLFDRINLDSKNSNPLH